MYNDPTKDIETGHLIFNAVMAFINLIFMLLLAFWQTKFWLFNMICSIYMNFTHYIIFESIKVLSFIENQNIVGAFIITIIEFVTKGFWLFFVDDNFIYNICCYLAFLPVYIAGTVNLYEKQPNDTGFFLITFSFLNLGIYFIERIFKINFFGNATFEREIERNANLIDNMKSGFVMFNLDDSKVTCNKIMKNKYIPKLLQGTNTSDLAHLDIFKKDEVEEYDEKEKQFYGNDKEKELLKEQEKNNQLLEDEVLQNKLIENQKQCNIVKNILFSRLDRVNAHDFDGELKKSSDEINQKINAFTTKSTKYNFYNQKNRVKLNEDNDVSAFGGQSEIPLIKETGFNLLFDNDFENMIAIFLHYKDSIGEFKYMGTKKIKQAEHEDAFSCQVFVRYHEHGRNLEFVICEASAKSNNRITSDVLAKGLINRTIDTNNFISNNKQKEMGVTLTTGFADIRNNAKQLPTAFLNKTNTTIKHPLKEISLKMQEILELLENPEENQDDIRELVYYCDNLSGLSTFALDELKYISKVGKKKINIDKEKIDLPQLLENIIDLSKAKLKFKSKFLKIVYDIGQNVDDVCISDSKKLSHVLLNLISNSINASSEGTIHIHVDCKSRRRDIIHFSVTDEGVAMKKDQINFFNKTLIEEFEKISGLVICKLLVEALGRDLKLETNSNSLGTKASFYLKVFDEDNINEDPQMTTDLSEDNESVDMNSNMDGTEKPLINNSQIKKHVGFKENMNNDFKFGGNIELQKINSNKQNFADIPKSFKRFSVALNSEIVDNYDLRIIYADDDPALREIFRRHVDTLAAQSNMKFDLIEFKDGADLLYALYTNFENNRYVDALLFDENMTFITGAVLVEIINILMKRSVIPQLGVFMATDYEMSTSFKFLKHLPKPIDYNMIRKNFAPLLHITPK
jgi:hypothetical protein